MGPAAAHFRRKLLCRTAFRRRFGEGPWEQALAPRRMMGRASVRKRVRARMVVHDTPAFREALEDEGVHASQVSGIADEMPAAQNQSSVRTKRTHLELREFKVSHRRAIRVLFAVTVEDRLPSASDAAAAGKSELRRVPIAAHECPYVRAIPGGLLFGKHGSDCRAVGFRELGAPSVTRSKRCHEDRKYRQSKECNRDSSIHRAAPDQQRRKIHEAGEALQPQGMTMAACGQDRTEWL